jgi:hypothetical protein
MSYSIGYVDELLKRSIVKATSDAPMTLGAVAAAAVHMGVWCTACQQQVESDPAGHTGRFVIHSVRRRRPDWNSHEYSARLHRRTITLHAL